MLNVINELKTCEKLQGQHKSNMILHATHLGRLVLIEENPTGMCQPKIKGAHKLCEAVAGGMGPDTPTPAWPDKPLQVPVNTQRVWRPQHF